MEFTTAELFTLQSILSDGIKTLDTIKQDNVRSQGNCVFSHQFILNNTLLKAIEHRIEELEGLRQRFGAEDEANEAASQELATADSEKEVASDGQV